MTTTTHVQMVEILKKEASQNPASNAVLHMMALRQRARSQVTIESLALKMKEEGFKFDKKDYEPLLRLMGKLGFGRLQTDPKGHIVALKDINVKLQSIGMAVCGKNFNFVKFNKKPKYRAFLHSITPEETKAPEVAKSAVKAVPVEPKAKKITVIVEIGDTPVTFPIPTNLDSDEFSYLMNQIKKFVS